MKKRIILSVSHQGDEPVLSILCKTEDQELLLHVQRGADKIKSLLESPELQKTIQDYLLPPETHQN